MFRVIFFLVVAISVLACHSRNEEKKEVENPVAKQEKLEAHEDSLELALAYQNQAKINLSITPDVETLMVRATSEDDAADDPAIWIHPTDRSKSLIFGSNKKGGLGAYDLKGKEVAYYPIGNINNVDVLKHFPLNGKSVAILGCTNRSKQGIDLFTINSTDGKLDYIGVDSLLVDPKLIDDIYGFCFAKDKTTQKSYALINGKNGLMQQFEMTDKNGKIALTLSRSVQFDSQTEGMAADTESGFLYVGEEAKGIWKLLIDPTNISKTFVPFSDESNPNIKYDVEGLTIYRNQNLGYLIASSQGNFSYAVFDLNGNNSYLTSFKITEQNGVDGVEETDGLDIFSDSLSAQFPKGIMVLQDGFNFDKNRQKVPQNFKYVEVGKLLDVLKK